MGKGGSAPQSPDYQALIPLQHRANLQQAEAGANLGRTNTITPWGSSQWVQSSAASSPSFRGLPVRPPMISAPLSGGSGGTMRAQGFLSNIRNALDPLGVSGETADALGLSQTVRKINSLSDGQEASSASTGQFGSPTGGSSGESVFDSMPIPQAGEWTNVQSLNPDEQRILDQQRSLRIGQGEMAQGLLGQAQQAYSQPAMFAQMLPQSQTIDAGGTNTLDGNLQYGGGPFDRQGAEDALYRRQTRFLEPRLQQEEQRAHERLISQGFNTDSSAYRDEMGKLREDQGLMRADMADRAITGAGQEASGELGRILQARGAAQGEKAAEFGQRQQLAQFAQSEQGRALADALSRIQVAQGDRARPLQELTQLQAGQSGQLSPSMLPQGGSGNVGVNGVDLMGAAQQGYQDQLGGWNANQARQQGNLQAGVALASTIAMMF